MRVGRLGFATLKGTRHLERTSVMLAEHGPVGDRAYCLVDPQRARVLRTVEHPALTVVEAADHDGELHLRLPDDQPLDGRPIDTRLLDDRLVEGRLDPTDEAPLTVEYWGRPATVQLLDGPHTAALAAYLEHPVRLAATRPGDVVWAGGVSLVTTGALERLTQRLEAAGIRVPTDLDERFRASITLEAADDPPPGTRLRLGTATIEVGRPIDRCAVVDIDPGTGRRDVQVLAHLDRHDGLLTFGVEAHVVRPGVVGVGDPAAREHAPH